MKLKREKNGYKDNISRQMNNYQIVREFSDLDIETVEFYKVNGVESVEVIYTFSYTFKNCTQAYLEEIQKQLNTPYKMRYRLILQKENNNWCVSKIVVKENLN